MCCHVGFHYARILFFVKPNFPPTPGFPPRVICAPHGRLEFSLSLFMTITGPPHAREAQFPRAAPRIVSYQLADFGWTFLYALFCLKFLPALFLPGSRP